MYKQLLLAQCLTLYRTLTGEYSTVRYNRFVLEDITDVYCEFQILLMQQNVGVGPKTIIISVVIEICAACQRGGLWEESLCGGIVEEGESWWRRRVLVRDFRTLILGF